MDTLIGMIGEVVSWNPPSSVPHNQLQSALSTAGLDPELSPKMQPRNGFKRATRELEEGRIIRQVDESADTLTFQFTKEFLDTQLGEFEYLKECNLTVNKVDGCITSTDLSLSQLATEKMTEKMGMRNASDVSRIIQALFKANGDLFPLRDSGGVYFVPAQHVGLVQQVEDVLTDIGGSMKRFELSNTPNAGKSVAVSIRDTLKELIADYSEYSKQINSENSKQVQTATNRIDEIRFKLSNYRTLLQSFDTEIEDAINAVTADLSAKVGVTEEDRVASATPGESQISDAQRLLQQLLA
jgi:division protein CdvB (Snf7/Vps24/ESCRT-III family)